MLYRACIWTWGVTRCWDSHVAAGHGLPRSNSSYQVAERGWYVSYRVRGVLWVQGGRSASPRWCSFTDSRWDWTGAVGLKLIPTPQRDPTEGDRSARSEPAVERIPDQACLSTLSAGPLLVCDTRPIHSMDRATQTPRACRSAHDHSFQGLNDMDRLFAKPSRAEHSRAEQRRRCLRIGINDAQG